MGHAGVIAGIIGGISLFWLASALFSTLRTSVNSILNFTTKKNGFYQRILDLILMIAVLILLLVSTFLSPIVTVLQHLGSQLLPDWLAYLLNSAIPRVVALVVSVILYVMLFYFLPHKRLSWKVIIISASTTVVLTETMRLLFTYYMKNASSIGALYGAYAFLIGISLWVYYASLAFLIGAEVGKLYKERNEPPAPKKKHLLKEIE